MPIEGGTYICINNISLRIVYTYIDFLAIHPIIIYISLYIAAHYIFVWFYLSSLIISFGIIHILYLLDSDIANNHLLYDNNLLPIKDWLFEN